MFRFGRKFLIALFFIPLTCIVVLSGKDDYRMAFAKSNKNLRHDVERGYKVTTKQQKEARIRVDKIVYGNKNADNQIILYLSPTCRSCAKLLKENIDYLKDIIDRSNGNISLEVKPYISSKGDLDVVKLMYIIPLMNGNVAGLESMNVLLRVFQNQNNWVTAKNPKSFLLKLFSKSGEQLAIQMNNKVLKNDIILKYKSDYDYFAKDSDTSLPIIKVKNIKLGMNEQYIGFLSRAEIREFLIKKLPIL